MGEWLRLLASLKIRVSSVNRTFFGHIITFSNCSCLETLTIAVGVEACAHVSGVGFFPEANNLNHSPKQVQCLKID
jgi:hypothetical protein